MSQPPEEYFDPTAPVGEGRRFAGHCSHKPDKSLIITRSRTGWAWYCHRCKEWGIRDLSGKSPAEKAAFIKSLSAQPIQTMKDIRLPLDYTRELTVEALAYCYTRGLTDTDIKQWKFGYSHKYGRLILPVYKDRRLLFYQGRAMFPITKDNPKYMNVYQSGRRGVYFVACKMFSGDVVIVEDIVSAIRVSYTADAYAMLSTHVPEALILELDEQYNTIYLWLDPDKLRKCAKLMRRYRSLGIDIKLIRSDKDPKFYNNENIRRYIYGK